MRYAEVCVDTPVSSLEDTFSYSVPESIPDIQIGQAVCVPFGNRVLQGIVLDLPEIPNFENVKPIIGLVEEYPLLSKKQIRLARLIKNYYHSSLYPALSLFLPPGFNRASIQYFSVNKPSDDSLTDKELTLYNAVDENQEISSKDLVKAVGKNVFNDSIKSLINRGFIKSEFKLDVPRINPKYVKSYSLTITEDAYEEVITDLTKKRAKSKIALLTFLYNEKNEVSVDVIKNAGFTTANLNSLLKLNYIKETMREVIRGSLEVNSVSRPDFELTQAQKNALSRINTSVDNSKGEKFLLHGVTGSGKTEVYLRASENCINQQKKVIVLVPEITLASQIIKHFAERFPGRCAVLHSGMTLGERYDQWRQIKRGKVDIVIGARSAIFAPFDEIGLIIVDEEHEYAYKQSDAQPVYHAVRIAETICKMDGSTLILGSATPDVSSYYGTKHNRLTLLELPDRINKKSLNNLKYSIVDMREEAKRGNTSLFSVKLKNEIKTALDNHNQIILFLNRRGDGTFIQCYECGYVFKCKSCSISMTYHSDTDNLICHRCNAKKALPEVCPECGGNHFTIHGIGTQTIEREIHALFPSARYLRWDADAIKTKNASLKLLSRMNNHEVDILIGTQSIAKGLHFPGVTLVGIINTDTMLNLPDFRACERTYQLISQAAGRAGRGLKPGSVIIQSYSPDNYAILAATKNDYKAFYEKEIKYRRESNYPPFNKLAIISAEHYDEVKIVEKLQKFKEILIKTAESKGISVDIVGPTPSFVNRYHGNYRYELTLRGQVNKLLDGIKIPSGYTINIDPLGLS